MTQKEKEAIALFVKVARHARNFPHPKIRVEDLRREGVEAEVAAERTFGEKVYEQICELAFKDNP